MKLNKIKFARLIWWLTWHCKADMDEADIAELDDIINIEAPTVSCSDVDELLRHINSPDGFISAIKAYRSLTGAGLKEGKEAIERYRNVKTNC